MKKHLLATIFLLLNASIFAQTEKNQLFTEITRSEQISKYRRVLLDKFIEKDVQAVKQLSFAMIKDLQDSNYIALFPAEYWLLMYWTQDYMELARTLELYQNTNAAPRSVQIFPAPDQLYERVLADTKANEETIVSQIKSADLDQEIEEFLLLNLSNFTFNHQNEMAYQNELNTRADAFLAQYPNTSYEYFIRNNIRYKMVPNPWFFEMGLFLGYGILTKDLAERYSNPFLFGVGGGAGYKKLSLLLRVVIGSHKTKQDLPYSTDTYAKGLSMTSEIMGLNMGYSVFENNWIKTTPYIGIARMRFGVSSTKTEEIPELDEIQLNYSTTWVAGIQLELYWRKKDAYYYQNEGFSVIRLGYSYNLPQYDQMYGIKGDYHTFTISYNLVFKSYKRDL
jgi:predicted Zn-dependent protease with MMP-like domain